MSGQIIAYSLDQIKTMPLEKLENSYIFVKKSGSDISVPYEKILIKELKGQFSDYEYKLDTYNKAQTAAAIFFTKSKTATPKTATPKTATPKSATLKSKTVKNTSWADVPEDYEDNVVTKTSSKSKTTINTIDDLEKTLNDQIVNDRLDLIKEYMSKQQEAINNLPEEEKKLLRDYLLHNSSYKYDMPEEDDSKYKKEYFTLHKYAKSIGKKVNFTFANQFFKKINNIIYTVYKNTMSNELASEHKKINDLYLFRGYAKAKNEEGKSKNVDGQFSYEVKSFLNRSIIFGEDKKIQLPTVTEFYNYAVTKGDKECDLLSKNDSHFDKCILLSIKIRPNVPFLAISTKFLNKEDSDNIIVIFPSTHKFYVNSQNCIKFNTKEYNGKVETYCVSVFRSTDKWTNPNITTKLNRGAPGKFTPVLTQKFNAAYANFAEKFKAAASATANRIAATTAKKVTQSKPAKSSNATKFLNDRKEAKAKRLEEAAKKKEEKAQRKLELVTKKAELAVEEASTNLQKETTLVGGKRKRTPLGELKKRLENLQNIAAVNSTESVIKNLQKLTEQVKKRTEKRKRTPIGELKKRLTNLRNTDSANRTQSFNAKLERLKEQVRKTKERLDKRDKKNLNKPKKNKKVTVTSIRKSIRRSNRK
jgi:hypothetical protein